MKTIGAFRTPVELLLPQDAADGAGGARRTYAVAGTLWARIEPVKATGGQGDDQEGATITHRITLRRRAGIDSAARLRLGGRVFHVVAAHDPDQRGRFLVCLCREPTA